MSATSPSSDVRSRLAALLLGVPPGRRGALMKCVASFRPSPTIEATFSVGPIRAAFAEYWQIQAESVVPIAGLRAILDPPVPIGTVLEFSKLAIARDDAEMKVFLWQLVQHLGEQLRKLGASQQLPLFDGIGRKPGLNGKSRVTGYTVQSLTRSWSTRD